MPRRVKEEAEKTRTRILASALALFVKKGYAHTTFTDIAARLKMTKGAVYWHFESKEALLVALVDEMLMKFGRQIAAVMPKDELTFPAVAEMMVKNAAQITGNAKGMAFFLLMHEQIQWSSASMGAVRQELLKDERFGPWRAFRTAVMNDVVAGRIREGVNADHVAHACVALWDGLVYARIAKFMESDDDMCETLKRSYEGVWASIRVV
ncbi:MAG: TetR family transcriptional regulator [bacterium]|nr:TetR family transcriptional regulator [bacterium]